MLKWVEKRCKDTPQVKRVGNVVNLVRRNVRVLFVSSIDTLIAPDAILLSLFGGVSCATGALMLTAHLFPTFLQQTVVGRGFPSYI